MSQRAVEGCVGLFLLATILSMLVLAFKVSGLTSFFNAEGYIVSAAFDDIGQLKVRSAVKIGGVTVGEVTRIKLDPNSYRAIVTMRINSKVKDIPNDSTASILTAGLLGDNYIALNPMYSRVFLKNGDEIQDTHSAMILEKLIGQFMFKMSNSDPKTTTNSDTKTKGVSS